MISMIHTHGFDAIFFDSAIAAVATKSWCPFEYLIYNEINLSSDASRNRFEAFQLQHNMSLTFYRGRHFTCLKRVESLSG